MQRKERHFTRMKLTRWILLLLTGVLLLTACAPSVVDTSSSDGSESSETDNSTPRQTLISVGKPYKTSSQPTASYPDVFGQQLTDGQKVPDIAADYLDVRMMAFTETTRIELDLGDDGKRITAISARCLDMDRYGIGLARSATFYGSADGESWARLGIVPFESAGVMNMAEARKVLDEPADYRYIRIMITMGTGSAFIFIDEVEVFADVPEPEKADTVAALYANEQIDRNAWKSLSTGKKADLPATENVALGASYTFGNTIFDERAPLQETYLTDGKPTGRLFGDPVWVAFAAENKADPATLTLDLGKACDNLYAFRLYAQGGGIDAAYPDAVDVYGSENGKDFVLLGRMYAPPETNNYTYTLLLPEYIKARYIRFDFLGETDCTWWLEEAEVIAGVEEAVGEYYPHVSFPTVKEDLFWDSAEADYKTSQNLLLGLPQQIATSFYEDTAKALTDGIGGETPADTPLLTDGKPASTTYCYSGEWFFHRGGGAINIFYDLGKISTIENLTVSLLEQTDWGISRPTHMTAFLSDDAVHWYPVAQYDREDGVQMSVSALRLNFDLTPETPLAARFVRFRVESAVLFIDELEAIGTKDASNATRLSESGLPSYLYYAADETAAYANPDNTPIKAKDIALVFGEKGDENSLLPMVAYIDAKGNIVDTFMDGFAYCITGDLPSGGQGHAANKKMDWEFLYNNTFNGKNGFDKLEEVVGQVKDALNKPDYRVQVYCTFLYPYPEVTDFGDVDGDGVSENLSTPEGRRTVIDWYMNLCVDEFNARGYKNLEFGGFYWTNEAVIWEWDDTPIIKEVANYVHEFGSYLLWIPYYTAHRYYLGYELGFDIVCMQPNHVFKLDTPFYRLLCTADRTLAQNMCVEIEHTTQARSDYRYARRYMQYLEYGARTGYMEGATHIYYDDYYNLADMAYTNNGLNRMQYDATYHFAKGDLNITPAKREDLSLSTAADTRLKGTLTPEGDDLPALYTLVSAPEHGSVSLTLDGQFIYYPEKGYTGSDSFAYTYNNYLGESEACVVNITVG